MFVFSFSEFCGENLSRYRFTRALSKLNTNILHLCFSQVGLDGTLKASQRPSHINDE